MENGGSGGKLLNGFTTLPSSGGHHAHLQNGHSHTLRAKSTLAAAAKKCSTSSSGSGGTASMDSCGSGSGGSGGSGGSCGPPSGSSCKSNSSSGSGAGPGASFSSSHSSHHQRNGHHQRSFSQATTVSFQHALLTHHLSSVCGGGVSSGDIPFGQSTLMDTETESGCNDGDESVPPNGCEPMSTSDVLDSAQKCLESKTGESDSHSTTAADGNVTANSNGKSSAPIIDLLKEFDVCFNSADHIDDDSSTLTDNSSVSVWTCFADSHN